MDRYSKPNNCLCGSEANYKEIIERNSDGKASYSYEIKCKTCSAEAKNEVSKESIFYVWNNFTSPALAKLKAEKVKEKELAAVKKVVESIKKNKLKIEYQPEKKNSKKDKSKNKSKQ